MFEVNKNLKLKLEQNITDSVAAVGNNEFMCGCHSGCTGACLGCTGCATYGNYPDGWHARWGARTGNERNAS